MRHSGRKDLVEKNAHRQSNITHAIIVVVFMYYPMLAGTSSLNAAGPVDPSNFVSCGVNALYCTTQLMGAKPDLNRIESLCDPDRDTVTSFHEMAIAAADLGFDSVGVDLTPEQIGSLPAPSILEIRPAAGARNGVNHFIVFLGQADAKGIFVLDPPFPPSILQHDRARQRLTGKALVLFDKSDVTRRRRFEAEMSASGTGCDAFIAAALLLVATATWWPMLGGQHPSTRVAASLLGIALGCMGCVDPGHEDLELVQRELSLGIVKLGKLNVTVPLRNAGNGMLEVRDVISSCGCTVAERHLVIKPGGVEMLPVEIAVTASGPGESRLKIVCNSGTTKSVVLRWFGEYIPQLVPASLTLSSRWDHEKETKPASIMFTGRAADDISISSITTSHSFLAASQSGPVREVANDEMYAGTEAKAKLFEMPIAVTLIDQERDGEMSGAVAVEISQASRKHELILPVRIEEHRAIEAVPPRVTLVITRSRNLDIALTRRIVVTCYSPNMPVVAASPDFLVTKLERLKTAMSGNERLYRYILTVSASRDALENASDDYLLLSCVDENGDAAELKLPISILRTPN